MSAGQDILVQRIDDLLPQTQCGKCGHPGCRPYARAVADGEAHNHCPPGGQATADALAELLARPSLPLDPRGYPDAATRQVAFIREDECIGCTKCIQACPVDAIVGAAKRMHTVIADECTGCDLCVAPCPVDCIDMLTVGGPAFDPRNPTERQRADQARDRFQAREARLAREQARKMERRQARRAEPPTAPPPAPAAPAGDDQRRQRLKLTTAYNMAHKQCKQARAALERAQRQGSGDLDAMRARVEAMQARADQARRRLDDLGPSDQAD
ncbi:electron transport complex subunit RsxB [Alloalcanivorax gelatiniphagus]|uniref:Electron transport complex subunit RsxB n=1 Tax=Alloalcanivorax gelatiniphagus TaxID=1194167 RepID=A0ABY2XM93_9GAMM|nr:electron transport complex subunit RsxB [Alloalcanivorax gelatiniphagus]